MKPQASNNTSIPSKLKNLGKAIPIFSLPDTAIAKPTRDHLPIADITEDIVIYKDGGAALVMESTSLNFGLLSEKEQQAIIVAYAALINSLSFSIQILVRSERKDISTYLHYLDGYAQKIQNQQLAKVMASYRQFITETVKKKNVLGKRFFMVIPFSPLELGISKSVMSVAKSSGPLPYSKSYVIKKAKVALYPKRDHLMRQARRLGISLHQLTTDEMIKLFFHIYNPEVPTTKEREVQGFDSVNQTIQNSQPNQPPKL